MRLPVVAAIVLAVAGSVGAYPTVYFEPEALFVDVEEQSSLSIRIDDGTDTLTCFLVEFSFDPAVVELTSAEEGSLFSESGHSTMFDWDPIEPGRHQCNDVTLGFDAYVICPGELVHLELVGVAAGTTTAVVEVVDLRDIRRDPIVPVGTGSCRLTVGPETGVVGDALNGSPLLRCVPNPFRSELAIELSVVRDEAVNFRVVGPDGRVVADLVGRATGTGTIAAEWDGTGTLGRQLTSGVYFVEARCGQEELARARVTLLR